MKTIWVVQYNDGTSDVWNEEKPGPAWPYVDAFEAEDAIKELRAELAESERHRQILTQQNAEFLADRKLPPRKRSACAGCSLPKDMDMVAIELEKASQILIALHDMKSADEWGPYALRNGQLHIQYLVMKEARNNAETEVERLKKIVEAPWKCSVCGNYVGNDSAVLEE